jgi:hypothetical protein
MSKRVEIEIEDTEADYQDIGDDDYGFVFDSDGNLKYAFIPEVLPVKPPKTIQKIMKVLGVVDLQQFDDDITLH